MGFSRGVPPAFFLPTEHLEAAQKKYFLHDGSAGLLPEHPGGRCHVFSRSVIEIERNFS